MDVASSSTASVNNRQKRVLPSRSRRGGPGVGHCEVDNLILETQRRKSENEPLIPADTPFLLTTNGKYANGSSDDAEPGLNINIVANDRYFDRPHVLKSFREQSSIQTPEFESIGETSSLVGGRFRPRGLEEEIAETSDSAYEKRHRKFETFEKRQRLREKEKLKHEHYKLKERIEQLRAMDGAAFMTLPAASFSPAPQQTGSDVEEPFDESGLANGSVANDEGERRRKEMLDIASKLEKRYAYLLPPDRLRKGQELGPIRKDTESREDEESETEQLSAVGLSKKDSSLKLRIPGMKSSTSTTPTPSPVPPKLIAPKRGRPAATPKQSTASSIRVLRNNSISILPVPLPPTEQRSLASSPYIDIEMESPESPPPPSTSPPVSAEIPNIDQPTRIQRISPKSATPDILPIEQNGADHVDVSMEPEPPTSAISQIKETQVASRQNGKASHTPPPMPALAYLQNDGESEKEDEVVEAPPKSKQGDEEDNMEIEETSGQEVSPEMREISTRLEQTSVTGPSAEGPDLATDQETADKPDQIEEGEPEVPSIEEFESISFRPTKRRRKNAKNIEVLSARTPSVQPGDSTIAAATSTRGPRGPRPKKGQVFAEYISSMTNEKLTTSSMLMVAAIRSAGVAFKRESGRTSRQNNSFGVKTPDFSKVLEVEYELPEEMLYPPDQEEYVPGPEGDDGDEASETAEGESKQEDAAGPVKEKESTSQPAGVDERSEKAPSVDADDAMETEPIQPDNGDPKQAEAETPISRDRTESVEPESQKLAELSNPNESKATTPEPETIEPIVGNQPSVVEEEPLVASPEGDPEIDPSPPPEPELDSGVRPRELSRHDNDEEELEW